MFWGKVETTTYCQFALFFLVYFSIFSTPNVLLEHISKYFIDDVKLQK